jgi:kynurenine formamidase
MASLSEFRKVADQVRNWGRWGAEDELGSLNFITAEKIAQAAGLVRQGKAFPLGADFGSKGPQGAFLFRQNPVHVMTVDGGDASTLIEYGGKWAANGTAQQLGGFFSTGLLRFNDDMIIMPLQAATQWDAFSHVYYEDQLYNGFPAASVTSQGAFRCGIDKVDVAGVTTRGVLLDVVKHRGRGPYLSDGQPVTPEELDDVARAQGVRIGTGDIVLVHTGWWERFLETGDGTVVADGLDWRCAQWLHEHEAAAVAADNLMVEDVNSGVDGQFMPLHLLCLRDMGLMLGEYWDLRALSADCAADGVYEFQLVAPPLRVIGAVGSPLNPIALK